MFDSKTMSVDMDTLGLRAAENAAEMAFIGVSQTRSLYLLHATYTLGTFTSAARKFLDFSISHASADWVLQGPLALSKDETMWFKLDSILKEMEIEEAPLFQEATLEKTGSQAFHK